LNSDAFGDAARLVVVLAGFTVCSKLAGVLRT
jgi:hypothetical protein